VNKEQGHQDRYDTYGYIDKEDPVPGPVIGNPATQKRTYDRAEHDPDAVKGHGHAMLRRGEGFQQYGLGHGLQGAAGYTLKNPENHKALYAPGETAQERADGKEGDGKNEESFSPDQPAQPTGHGNNDGIGCKV